MPAIPWSQRTTPEPDREYLVLGSYLPLRKRSKTITFFRFVGGVRTQLKTTDGLIGYTLDAHPFSGEYWTLSVWQDQAALDAFVAAHPHVDTMQALKSSLGPTTFDSWAVLGKDLPPTLAEAKRRLA